MRTLLVVPSLATAVVAVAAIGASAQGGQQGGGHQGGDHHRTLSVVVPDADRFTPFALTIRTGDTVRWVNTDADDHTVVSDDAFASAGHQGTDQVIRAYGGTFSLRFGHPGTFVYYCRFHARLDAFNQPVAPGPDGGIRDASGNFGTPMSGVITVLPGNGQA
jgi:plastocyanin